MLHGFSILIQKFNYIFYVSLFVIVSNEWLRTVNYLSVAILVDPRLNQESKCVNKFDAGIVIAQNI